MDVFQMYQDKEGEYTWKSPIEKDNNGAMEDFLTHYDLHKFVIENDGTLVFLYIEGKRQLIVLESYGHGDTYSHAVSYRLECLSGYEDDKDIVSKINEVNGGPLKEECQACRGSGEGRYDGCCSECRGAGVVVIFGEKAG